MKGFSWPLTLGSCVFFALSNLADSGAADDDEEMAPPAPTVVYINAPQPSTPAPPAPVKSAKHRGAQGDAAGKTQTAQGEDCDAGGPRSLWVEVKSAFKPYCKDFEPPNVAAAASPKPPPRQVRYTLAN